MTKFLKLDMADEDNLTISEVEAENMEGLLKTEISAYKNDDNLCGCYGVTPEFSIGNSAEGMKAICWAPGDGGKYTIAVFGPNDESTKAIFAEMIG